MPAIPPPMVRRDGYSSVQPESEGGTALATACAGPGVIHPQWVAAMARDAMVCACGNPVPDIWPWEAADAEASSGATGRSDFPNQVHV